MARIEPVSKSKTKNYGDAEIKNFWLKRSGVVTSADQGQPVYSKIKELIDPAENGVICVQSENLSDSSLIKDLFNAADRGNRIYLLTHSSQKELRGLYGRCLIRYGLKNMGSFVLVNPRSDNPRGALYTGQFTEGGLQFPSNLSFELDGEQTAFLYRHFCYHFWNSAAQEIIDASGEKRDTGAAPVDIFPPGEDLCDVKQMKNKINTLTGSITILTDSIANKEYLDFTGIKNAAIITSLTWNNTGAIPGIKEQGNAILALEKGNFLNIIAAEEGYWIIPKSIVAADDIFFALKANEIQRTGIESRIEQLRNNADYEFIASEKRKNLSGKTMFFLDKEPKDGFTTNETALKNMGDIPQTKLLSLNELENFEPEFPDNGKDVSITYQWRNMPFYLPNGSVDHPLYGQWKTEKDKILDMLNSIVKKIDTVEKNESGMAKAKRFARFLLGKKQEFSEYEDQIKELQDVKFDRLPPEELKAKIHEINEIHEKIITGSAEIAEESRKAKLDEEIEDLNEKIKTKELELQEKQKDLASKEEEQKNKLAEFYKNYVEEQKSLYTAKLENEIEQERNAIREKEDLLKKKEEELDAEVRKPNGEPENDTVSLPITEETERREENGKEE
jgi:hypothetical protein